MNDSLEDLRRTWMAGQDGTKTVFISATEKENIGELRDLLYSEVRRIHVTRYPYDDFLYPGPESV